MIQEFFKLLLMPFQDWRYLLEILILWMVIYRIFIFLKGTKAVYVLRGIIILLISFVISQWFGFYVLNWILTKLFAFFLILVAIVFQPELREGLVRLGKPHFFPLELKQEEIDQLIKEIVIALTRMAKKRIGALIAIKREISLNNFIDTGISLKADLSAELLENIFYPSSPLHDGGVIIEGTTVLCASALFPLTDNPNIERRLGMRHRAAVGISEASDAVVLIVSEENGAVSMAINGQLTRNLSAEDLLTILKGQLRREK